jgi:hypothetical protein
MADAGSVLLLGNADSGKTTLITQLYLRLQAGEGRLRMLRAPSSLKPILASSERLAQGLAVEHTPQFTNVEQVLHAVDADGVAIDMRLPDYPGESLADVVTRRQVPPLWRERLRSAARWILLLRLSQQPELPDVYHRPVAAARSAPPAQDSGASQPLQLDLWAVELLQMLLFVMRSGDEPLPPPPLTIALNCWDELTLAPGSTPASVLSERAPLVGSFCAAQWTAELTVIGLSPQGQTLHRDKEAAAFIDLGPQRMGWLVTADGSRDPDLTRLLTGQ